MLDAFFSRSMTTTADVKGGEWLKVLDVYHAQLAKLSFGENSDIICSDFFFLQLFSKFVPAYINIYIYQVPGMYQVCTRYQGICLVL